jgi:hypothetical protein
VAKKYAFYQTQIGPRGFAAILKMGTERFEQAPSPFRIAVTPSGICINGEYGSNPSKEEMRETLEVMREAVLQWDKQHG